MTSAFTDLAACNESEQICMYLNKNYVENFNPLVNDCMIQLYRVPCNFTAQLTHCNTTRGLPVIHRSLPPKLATNRPTCLYIFQTLRKTKDGLSETYSKRCWQRDLQAIICQLDVAPHSVFLSSPKILNRSKIFKC